MIKMHGMLMGLGLAAVMLTVPAMAASSATVRVALMIWRR
jgi:hypothetical protein